MYRKKIKLFDEKTKQKSSCNFYMSSNALLIQFISDWEVMLRLFSLGKTSNNIRQQ